LKGYLTLAWFQNNGQEAKKWLNAVQNIDDVSYAYVQKKDGTINYLKIKNIKTGEVFYNNLRFQDMAAKTISSSIDSEKYDFLDNYLAEYVHPNIASLDSYHNGIRLNIGEIEQEGEAYVYNLFLLTLILDQATNTIKISMIIKKSIHQVLNEAKELFFTTFGSKDSDKTSHMMDLILNRLSYI
jgi:hypothetical protein